MSNPTEPNMPSDADTQQLLRELSSPPKISPATVPSIDMALQRLRALVMDLDGAGVTP